ncbi:hypothetical protein DNI29_23420 [Hymenobacter sediminis]|uniref:Imm43 family immunity protein n=1 Tax=Hymenobacter sediminis TaxID=2218621 RepID=UPI000DA69E64|nr:Imm43 family immunity protein [Hymenobacter sediminis]RPD43596.1 hypothetical protein DNI29_23420 [Hymenobacter sediminis]
MLYVTHPIWDSQEKQGLFTYIERTLTEEFNEKKPMQGIYTRNWKSYKWYRDGAPVLEDMHLPDHLIMVCKGIRRFQHDFFADDLRQWIISAKFRDFLRSHNLLEGHYEESQLTVVSTKNQPLAEQPYYLWRLFRHDNALVDFEKTPRVVSPVKPFTEYTPPKVYYPELMFQNQAQVPDLFYLDDPNYWSSFFCNEEIKLAMEKENFLGFDFYSLKEYMRVCIEQEEKGRI